MSKKIQIQILLQKTCEGSGAKRNTRFYILFKANM